jgi:hypothetical protein
VNFWWRCGGRRDLEYVAECEEELEDDEEDKDVKEFGRVEEGDKLLMRDL